ncbi:hypothetical protein LX15_003335 [Streptoalloteichus tenebrarius]|uniref:DUF5666 domain-containing protein n=1 Tax=Streptoalloteichus tenebrarius (strain ATCC 17920 / DSM 40477 / JCM 4838 / CBS 697.72 / NBRC 16177 / NCIMB 11028 / NRRL B-12390 / A12253. 1 / ISP 5477) TaxID=1933 RepID=A0ABT1HVT4_STRSD|nr:DUF5666 domain-containing protein [Streptoalloteichus tenebrarius]MCP2259630.1 hypothetical protein [Streptoalloteichus tenebrarius]BFF00963.1 hypothetical protein GCM10020241_26380 [Streptoalloteichus tenebrarius]
MEDMTDRPEAGHEPGHQPAIGTARPRRRGWLWPVATGVSLAGVTAAVVLGAGALTGTPAAASGSRLVDLPLAGDTAEGRLAPAAERAGGEGDHGKPRRGQVREGQTILAGTVQEAKDDRLVVNRDGGGQVTVTTNGGTKVRGSGVDSLAALRQGQRVVVRVDRENRALSVRVPAAHAVGTVTAINGGRGTLLRGDGLTLALDLSGVRDAPKVGDLVAVRGTPTEGGGTLKVTEVRMLPRTGG